MQLKIQGYTDEQIQNAKYEVNSMLSSDLHRQIIEYELETEESVFNVIARARHISDTLPYIIVAIVIALPMTTMLSFDIWAVSEESILKNLWAAIPLGTIMLLILSICGLIFWGLGDSMQSILKTNILPLKSYAKPFTLIAMSIAWMAFFGLYQQGSPYREDLQVVDWTIKGLFISALIVNGSLSIYKMFDDPFDLRVRYFSATVSTLIGCLAMFAALWLIL